VRYLQLLHDNNRQPAAVSTQVLVYKQTNKNSLALTPQANYTDRVIATCQQNLVPTFVDIAVSRGQHGGSPTVVF
jgi:hypothetical protein